MYALLLIITWLAITVFVLARVSWLPARVQPAVKSFRALLLAHWGKP